MTRPDTAMIFAAGFGTRMGVLTADRPKPLLPLGGATLLDHALDIVAEAGVRRAVVNLHYQGDQIRAHLAGRRIPEILFSNEQPEILDTGGGMVQARPLLAEGPVFGLNSDNVFTGPNPLETLARGWGDDGIDALLLVVPRAQARAYEREGDYRILADGRAEHRGTAATAPYVYTGAQIIRPSVLDGAPAEPFSMRKVWDRLQGKGRLGAVIHPGGWVDVGTPAGLAEAEAALAAEPT